MRGLAEFAMRDRFRALLVVTVGVGSMLFSWIGAAVLALVTLRKGAGEGAWLLMWALLPAGAQVVLVGDTSSLSLLLGAMALALVLRNTVSLALTVLAGAVVGVLTGVLMMLFGSGLLETLVEAYGTLISGLEQQLETSGETQVPLLPTPTPLMVAGMMGAGTATMSLLSLMLARYWQAALYNPGGFGEEFRALALPPMVALVLAVAAVAGLVAGLEYQFWAVSLMLPLVVCGLALVHAYARYRGFGSPFLGAVYAAWLLLPPVRLMLIVAALLDSFMGFRRKWAKPQQGDPDDGEPQ